MTVPSKVRNGHFFPVEMGIAMLWLLCFFAFCYQEAWNVNKIMSLGHNFYGMSETKANFSYLHVTVR